MTLFFRISSLVAKIIRTLVFWPAKNGFKSVIYIFCCRKYQFTFPNINFAINCYNPVRLHEETEQTEPD